MLIHRKRWVSGLAMLWWIVLPVRQAQASPFSYSFTGTFPSLGVTQAQWTYESPTLLTATSTTLPASALSSASSSSDCGLQPMEIYFENHDSSIGMMMAGSSSSGSCLASDAANYCQLPRACDNPGCACVPD